MANFILRCFRLGGAVAVFALAQAAFATPLTLTGPIAGNTLGPQSASNPCIIAGTHCQQPAGFGYNDFTSNGNLAAYNLYSTSTTPYGTLGDGVMGSPYNVGQINSVLGSRKFVVAIDVNTTGAAGETLSLFEVIVNGVVWYDYIGPTNIANIANNGNGFGDWTLGAIDLTSFADSATVLFHAQWYGASDGAESFYLSALPPCDGCVPTPTAVAEPSSLALLGLALASLALTRSRRRRH